MTETTASSQSQAAVAVTLTAAARERSAQIATSTPIRMPERRLDGGGPLRCAGVRAGRDPRGHGDQQHRHQPADPGAEREGDPAQQAATVVGRGHRGRARLGGGVAPATGRQVELRRRSSGAADPARWRASVTGGSGLRRCVALVQPLRADRAEDRRAGSEPGRPGEAIRPGRVGRTGIGGRPGDDAQPVAEAQLCGTRAGSDPDRRGDRHSPALSGHAGQRNVPSSARRVARPAGVDRRCGRVGRRAVRSPVMRRWAV